MYHSAADFQKFYHTREGFVIRRMIRSHIKILGAGDAHGEVAGLGYSLPYLDLFEGRTERTYALMPSSIGAASWPKSGPNLTALVHSAELPLPANSLDVALGVHFLEFAEYPEAVLQEIWRVLKPTGKLILIVPNRTGLWARSEWSPFGHGKPFSLTQLQDDLSEAQFVTETIRPALFMPPLKWRWMLKAAWSFEQAGNILFPGVSGLHCVTAVKQLYAPASPPKGRAIRVAGTAAADLKPAASSLAAPLNHRKVTKA
ncbi:MAG: class I SAM-dependent methyltransferase [Pseudobdellovibrionaceae bacterium]